MKRLPKIFGFPDLTLKHIKLKQIKTVMYRFYCFYKFKPSLHVMINLNKIFLQSPIIIRFLQFEFCPTIQQF